MVKPLDAHYLHPRLVDVYDIESGWSPDRDFYLSLAGTSPKAILDLGCGTGLICRAYAANNHDVTGVDPSQAMLDVGRQKPNGDKVNWVCSFAHDYRSDKRFDLIIMTGHAFQVLLSDADVMAVFAMIREHLTPTGQVVFESRNPALDWKSIWDYEVDLEIPNETIHQSRHLISMEDQLLTFESHYQFSDELLVSRSTLRFMPKGDIVTLLTQAGLLLESVKGDWDGGDFSETSSREMIFVAGIETNKE